MSSGQASYPLPRAARLWDRSQRGVLARAVLGAPELFALLFIAGVLNLWNLTINGWANTYYSAAVKSMAASWHNFLYASMDPSGLMTVDKPPLSLWVQALSARIFGFHPLSLLIPQAIMGMVAVGLLYDLTRRRFGRAAGFVAGLALATTPVIVAVSRHNNPDELLVLCCVAALWFFMRALDDGRTRWLVLSGLAVGLGFETKMGVALMVVPGIAAAWLWIAPAGRLRAIRQLVSGGAALVAAACAWPLLVTLTPAADRPWISGTSDNSVWSLIFGYNGLGRVAGQTGGPGGGAGGGGTMFGGATGPFRLLQSGLGDQAGWLLGSAAVAAAALLVMTRLRRRDPRTGWLIAVAGAAATTAVVFSFASGIFHPYYVSFLAPFVAALVGAGVGEMLPAPFGVARSTRSARIVAPLLIAGGVITELVVLGTLSGSLGWATPLVAAVGAGTAIALTLKLAPRVRAVLVAVALAALLAAPATWAAETLGHATNGTFPTGGPATALGGPGGGPGGARFAGRGPGGFAPPSGATGLAPPTGATGGLPPSGAAGFAPPSGGGFAGGGAFGGNSATLTAAIAYARSHGGGTIGVESQSTAAAAIISDNANVAGLGGFSGRESSVTASWLATEVRSGHLRWLIADGNAGGRLPGDTRTGSQSALTAAENACRKVTIAAPGSKVVLYDCVGRADALQRATTS
jgi:4-amino-4-deoxy-L-arabinose transferase-like glycosyltransferase